MVFDLLLHICFSRQSSLGRGVRRRVGAVGQVVSLFFQCLGCASRDGAMCPTRNLSCKRLVCAVSRLSENGAYREAKGHERQSGNRIA